MSTKLGDVHKATTKVFIEDTKMSAKAKKEAGKEGSEATKMTVGIVTTDMNSEVKEIQLSESAMAARVRRDSFKLFWDKYSDKPDTNTMMLNHSAEDLEAADRADILSCLPHLANKDVVDIGAGIGRFTTVLAETARYVLSTDFIESFMAKNKERNGHMGNVNYQVGDAVHLQMDAKSVDLVFTNWLMMYLSDKETIEFLLNSMRWLRADGFVHLRESCSEPSTGRTKTNTMHTSDTNPTHYRYSSLYIQLLRNLRYQDDDGRVWRFDLQWSCSVPTYIKRQHNWRQVHWLVKKVPAPGDKPTTPEELLELFSVKWSQEQKHWDAELDDMRYIWTDSVFSKVLNEDVVARNSTAFVYTPRTSSAFTTINSHLLAEKFNSNVWHVETEPYYYRTSLTKANNIKDQRVRYSWNSSLGSSIQYWNQRQASFDSFISTDFLKSTTQEERRNISTIMRPEARVVLLEEASTIDEIKEKIAEMGLQNVKIEDVTDQCFEAQTAFFKDHEKNYKPVGSRWFVIKSQF